MAQVMSFAGSSMPSIRSVNGGGASDDMVMVICSIPYRIKNYPKERK
jgi:hypothetical protein